VGVFVPSTGCKDVVAGLVSTASAIACTVKSKPVPVGTDGSMVEDTTVKTQNAEGVTGWNLAGTELCGNRVMGCWRY
jgi:hypothetical protein